jgi:hypothetical protein
VDPADSFFQALDSEQLLKEHGRSLVADARELLLSMAASNRVIPAVCRASGSS